MNERVRCKVRDIKDSAGRWEIRLEQKILPDVVVRLAGKLKFPAGDYTARTGIASRGKPNQYFWINTRMDEAGPIRSILEVHGYRPNDEIVLSIEEANRIAYVTSSSSLSPTGSDGREYKGRTHIEV